MEETKILSPQLKGLIIALIVIVFGLIGYYTNIAFEGNGWYSWVVNGIALIAIIIACVHYANQMEGAVTFGKVFMHGFKATLVMTIILLVYTLIAFKFLFPDMQEKIFDMQRAAMEKKEMPEDQIDTAMGMIRRYFMVGLIFGLIIGNLIWGCIGSLLGAAFAKKNRINPLDQLPS